MAAQLLGNDSEADDALYEAFARLWPRRELLTTAAQEEAMLATTVRHLSIDILRQRQAHPECDIEQTSLSLHEEETDEVEERYHKVAALIAQHLTPQQQLILRRHDIEGESYEQLSADLNITETALRQILSRARQKIRQLYLLQHTHTP